MSNESTESNLSSLIIGGYDGRAGGRRDFFLSDITGRTLKTYIDEKKLTPSTSTNLMAQATVSMKPETLAPGRQIPFQHGGGISGGIKAPHIHHNGEIYFLTDKQWNEFSQRVIEGFQNKLAHAKGVNFDQLMKLSDVMSEIVSDE